MQIRSIFFLLPLVPFTAFADPIEIAFSPHAGATELVVKTINSAQKTVELAAYNFTSTPIRDALIDAHKRGVDVKVVVDKSEPTEKNEVGTALIQSGIPVRVDHMYHIMHDKYIVVDNDTVETGSFNFSLNAESGNAENLIVIHHNLDIASKYDTNWKKLWNESVAQ